MKPFWPSKPIFPPNLPPKCPNMMIDHVVGPHWYLYRVPASSNMTIMTIFLNPTCQSWPQMSKLAKLSKIQISCVKLISPPPITQVLIENMHAGFKMVCTILLEGQKHPFWPKTPLFWPFFKQFLALDPKNSVLCAKILLLHGIPGYNLHRI